MKGHFLLQAGILPLSMVWPALAGGATHVIGNKTIQAALDSASGLLTVTDARSGQIWRQTPGEGQWTIQSVDASKAPQGKLAARIKSGKPDLDLVWTIELGPAEDEVTCRLSGAPEQPMDEDLLFPHPFAGADGQLMINEKEGMLVPVQDVPLAGGVKESAFIPDSAEKRLTFSAHVLGEKSAMTLCLSPDDARIPSIRVMIEGQPRLAQQLLWRPRFKTFGVDRSWRYVFLNDGGYVGAAKRYRKHALENGTLKLFSDPAKANPKLDRLFGAVDIYLWDTARSLDVVEDLQRAGIDRAILSWDPSHFPYITPSLAKEIDARGYLLGVYDLYREVHEPGFAGRKYLSAFDRRVLPDEADAQWLVWDTPDGPFMRRERTTTFGLPVKNHFLAYPYAVKIAQQRFAEEKQFYPYSARFLDTLSAQPLLENWNPNLKTTRTGEREARQAVAQFFLDQKQLVGSENVSAWYLGYGHYIEGAVSFDTQLGRGRGRQTGDEEPAENRSRRSGGEGAGESGSRGADVFSSRLLRHIDPGKPFLEGQLGPLYNVPTLDLIAHDGVVTCSHWRDSSQRHGERAWKVRDLQNLLYGDMALWNLDREEWRTYRDQFIQSYQTISPWFRKVGGAEMLSHRFLGADRAVQETRFATGDAMVVNFGAQPFTMDDGTVVPALGHHAYRFEEEPPESRPVAGKSRE